jgi:sec-independent protein translocase protein TatB
MLRAMFGMGGTEILVILIVALLFLGPDKLPDAAKKISKGIRDIKKQSRILQRTIEDDEHIGGAIRDLRSALRGDEEPIRPRPIKPPKQIEAASAPDPAAAVAALAMHDPDPDSLDAGRASAAPATADTALAAPAIADRAFEGGHSASAEAALVGAAPGRTAEATPVSDVPDVPKLTLPATAGEAASDQPASTAHQDAELAALVKPAPNTIARGAAPAPAPAESSEPSEPKHG